MRAKAQLQIDRDQIDLTVLGGDRRWHCGAPDAGEFWNELP